MTKVNITDIQGNKDGSVQILDSSKSVEINPIRPAQFGALTKVINETQKDLQSNEDFKLTVQKLFGEYQDGFDLEDLFRSEEFNVFSIMDAVGFLLEAVPDRLTEIVAIMSGINRFTVEHQDMDTYFDLIEAVLEVNDIEKIVARVKKISTQVGKAFSFLTPQQDNGQTTSA
ncbi:hypothetical protein QI193_02620 [Staphylococcus saprophyticus]|nr:hypothetical protein [Staphylococcus saprophyticus]